MPLTLTHVCPKYGTTFHLLYKTEMWFQKYVVPLYFTYKMWLGFFYILHMFYMHLGADGDFVNIIIMPT